MGEIKDLIDKIEKDYPGIDQVLLNNLKTLERRIDETKYQQKLIEADIKYLKFRMDELEKSKLQLEKTLIKLKTTKYEINKIEEILRSI